MGRLIDADAAIDAVERAKTAITADGEIYCAKINAQMNIQLLPSAQPRWIPVSERLPQKFGYCLVSGCRSVWFASFENGEFRGILSGHALDSVVAWMPLPEPYKETEG